jgi:hypothetical protein
MNAFREKLLTSSLALARQLLPDLVSKPKRHAKALIAACALFTGVVRRTTYSQSQLVNELLRSHPVFGDYFPDLETCFLQVMDLARDLNTQVTLSSVQAGSAQIEIFRLIAIITDNLDFERIEELLKLSREMRDVEDYDHSTEQAVALVYAQLLKTLGVEDQHAPAERTADMSAA